MAPLLRPGCHASTMWRLTYSFSLLCIFDALDGHLHLPHCKKASMELSCGVTKTVQCHYLMYWRVWSLLLFAILAPSSLQVETRSSQVPVRVATHGQGPVRHENSICVSSSVDSSSKCVCGCKIYRGIGLTDSISVLLFCMNVPNSFVFIFFIGKDGRKYWIQWKRISPVSNKYYLLSQ